MKAAVCVGLALLVGACASVSPVPIASGDVCYRCGQRILDTKLAAEAVATDGTVMKFRTIRCLAQQLMDNQRQMAGIFVTDYPSGRFLRPETATFVLATVDAGDGERQFVAFANVSAAVAFGERQFSKPIDWLRVMQAVRSEAAE